MVVTEVAVKNKGTKACGELQLLLFAPEIESITHRPIMIVVAAKALTLADACLLTKGDIQEIVFDC